MYVTAASLAHEQLLKYLEVLCLSLVLSYSLLAEINSIDVRQFSVTNW